MHIQWFPGHMTKALRMMEENVKLVDCLIYVLDSRCIVASFNPKLNQLAGGKPILYVLNKADLVASFQASIVDVLVEHAINATKEYHMDKLAIAGGVASNSALRSAMKEACKKNGIQFFHPSPIFCTDNAAMIGAAAYYEYQKGTRHGWDLNAVANLKLGER